MTLWELGITILLYLNVARRVYSVDPGAAVAWTAYAVANVGWIISASRIVQ
jgi:hypothetical protein